MAWFKRVHRCLSWQLMLIPSIFDKIFRPLKFCGVNSDLPSMLFYYSKIPIESPYLKQFLRYLGDKFKKPKFSKDHTSKKNWWNLFKSLSGNLLIILYQLTNFQTSSSNTFREILLTSLKCPNLQRAITPELIDWICSKVNQVTYSSSPTSWPSLKSLA